MMEILFNYFESKAPLTEDNRNVIRSVFREMHLKKSDFFQQKGEVARYAAFVTKGFMRSYIIDSKGKEHIIQFAPENWWISDSAGLISQGLSEYFIDAIEDSDLLLLDREGHRKLLEEIPMYGIAFQKGLQKHADAKNQRIATALASNAEERYTDFLKTYPSIVQRIPQHMLASYLGITPETVSRIRRKLVKK